MKTYHPPLESNGRDCGFLKLALYALEKDDKSSFSMSGHVESCRPLRSLAYPRIRLTGSSRVLGFTATDFSGNSHLVHESITYHNT